MTSLASLGRGAIAAALLGSLVAAAPAAPPAAARYADLPGDGGTTVTVTPRDVAASNEKARMAYADLVTMWTGAFEEVGARFAPPALSRYRGAVRTGCGVMGGDNAAYCARENAIYFDEVFVAGQAKRAARQLGTDGDMAAIGVIAHEMGHAVAIQLGHVARTTYANEAVADCLAGTFARRADAQGSLEEGDVDEAFYAMYTAGDPTLALAQSRGLDGRTLARIASRSHGTREQRMQNFRTGLEGGPGACIAELQGVE
jgi:predicted metalloprotease